MIRSKNNMKIDCTRPSHAFLGISTKSERRSFCSFSKSSCPNGPTKPSFIGLSLNELKGKRK